MRTGITISTLGHVAFLVWATVTLTAIPYKADMPKSIVVDIKVDAGDSQLTAGARTAPKVETAKPVAEKVAERKVADDPTAKLEKKEIKAATDLPPPMPEPRPPAPAEKKQSEPKRDLIADAIKKDVAKKSEPRKAEAKAPAPPKKQEAPKFDPRQVEALLDKRNPQRLAATGDALNSTVALGAPRGTAAQLSQSEFDALRARLAQLWNPPVGASNPEELVVLIRMRLKPDRTLAAPPQVLNSGRSSLFMASRDRAVSAIFRGQPFDMLKPENYEQWKDIEIVFDPRHMIDG